MARIYPLSGAFMIIALLGLIFSGIVLSGEGSEAGVVEQKGYDPTKAWAFTFMFLFGLMFVASVISMTFGPEEVLKS